MDKKLPQRVAATYDIIARTSAKIMATETVAQLLVCGCEDEMVARSKSGASWQERPPPGEARLILDPAAGFTAA